MKFDFAFSEITPLATKIRIKRYGRRYEDAGVGIIQGRLYSQSPRHSLQPVSEKLASFVCSKCVVNFFVYLVGWGGGFDEVVVVGVRTLLTFEIVLL
jgi:hypothetical protein